MADEPEPAARVQRVTMPKWGLSMKTGKIVEWLVAEGDEIRPGMDLADIETDKIAGTLESTQEGVLRRLVAPVGADVPVSGTIAVVAPADVPDDVIDATVREAEAQLAAGEVEEAAGPVVSTVEAGGRPVSYATLGDGAETVVLVHGYGGDKNSWLFVQEPLAAGRTVHALDLPGHGESGKDVGDGSLDLLAGTVLGFLDALGIARAHLVGHSLGGAVIAAVVAAAPERVGSVTLVAPVGWGPEIDAAYLRGFAAAESRRDLKPLLGRLFADEGLVTRQLVDDVLRYKRLDGVTRALQALLGTLLDGDAQRIDARPLLAKGEVPVAAVWGRADRIIPAAQADAVTDALGPRARVEVVDGAGHMVHMEAPAAVCAAVSAAVSAAAAGGGGQRAE